ncbi:slit homolog 3 protein-like [Mizuhopecten yessoensis]|uniref:Platelet glycoprotein V n=1 Tax=Mizuhopecten yessoensis TaxID=6573 RepID=A0A210QQZ8_MIZYE|nr:slit homolog 3 protein-like [Mizuhopecten yessoensis]OWF51144.1 Platelet glycoprotein V [Mizuhopecten yessoensis]
MTNKKIWATTLALLLSALICDSKTGVPCPPKCKCRFRQKSAKCGGLQTIPKLPHYVKHVLFAGTNFTTVSDVLLFNLSQNTIASLDFVDTNTVNVEPDAFSAFLNLTHLSFDSNRKLNPDVVPAFLNQTLNLHEINLESNGWNSIPVFMFAGLQDSLLKKISLKNNNIKYVSASFFSDVHSLEQLDLSRNDLTEFNTTGFESTNILTVNIGFNHLLHIPSFCGPLGTKTGNYTTLDLTSNPVYSLNQSSFSCLRNLRTLKLDEISVRELKNNTFADLPRLRSLKMNSNSVHINRIELSAFNSSSLQRLSFGANRFRFDRQNNSNLRMFSFSAELVP